MASRAGGRRGIAGIANAENTRSRQTTSRARTNQPPRPAELGEFFGRDVSSGGGGRQRDSGWGVLGPRWDSLMAEVPPRGERQTTLWGLRHPLSNDDMRRSRISKRPRPNRAVLLRSNLRGVGCKCVIIQRGREKITALSLGPGPPPRWSMASCLVLQKLLLG